MPDSNPASLPGHADGVFVTTCWTLVLQAGSRETTQSHDALDRLCQTYWYPLYAYVRRRGYRPHDAQDLTQEFFARLLEKHWLADVNRERGRFRSFLLAAMKHFLANEGDKARAQKRGGGQKCVELDAASAEERYALEPVDNATADRIFERRWALTLLDRVLARLRAAHVQAGKEEQFEVLKGALAGGSSTQPYAELAAQLGQSEGAVKVAVHRLRLRYRELLREEIATTVSNETEVEDELRHLFTLLAK